MSEATDRCDRAMRQAVVDTLENMVFMEVSPIPPESAATSPQDLMSVGLLIHDPLQGELRLRMPRKLVALITAGVYSLEPEELTDQMLCDNFAELINIIAGRFMCELLIDGRPFRLGLPEPEPEEIDPNAPLRTWAYTINDLSFSLTATGPALWTE
jgi:CheY-specific phosphatase CheX